ncbi:MAG: outer membrane protein assembly factor BamC [Thiotrichales bacterium]|nr:outer membrane protein assembly factor BamC [Thiotrichales bacterium]MCY4350993.1 outer membrane protein assembly factor BamC [Thiotrichales bacterium]
MIEVEMAESMSLMQGRTGYGTTLGVVVVAGALLVGGCSGTTEGSGSEATYKSSRSAPPLEIPPDLSSGAVRDTLPIPGVDATYSQYASGEVRPGTRAAQAVLPAVDSARIERSGDERWLVVAMKPEELWPRLRDFWVDQGFVLETENPEIGLMETEWAARHTPLPAGAIKRLLLQATDALYGVTFRDRYRTRIERGTDSDATEIYISHRGAEQTVVGDETPTAQREGLGERVWLPRPGDSGLEALMLSRLMIFLGVDEERAESIVAAGDPPVPRARLVREDGGATALVLDEGFSQAWRRAGLALDRAGFAVEDRDRSRGLFFVRYSGVGDDREDEGWLSRLKFWKSDEEEDVGAYLVRVQGDAADTSRIVIVDETGTTDGSPAASRILTVLQEQLR